MSCFYCGAFKHWQDAWSMSSWHVGSWASQGQRSYAVFHSPLIATALLLHHSASRYYWHSLIYTNSILIHCIHCIYCTHCTLVHTDTIWHYWSFMVLPRGDDDKGSTGHVDSFFSGDPLASLFNAGRWVGRPGIVSAECRNVSSVWDEPEPIRKSNADWIEFMVRTWEWKDEVIWSFLHENTWSCYVRLYHVISCWRKRVFVVCCCSANWIVVIQCNLQHFVGRRSCW